MRYIRWFVVLLVAIGLAVFAVSNRGMVDVTFWPLPFELAAPLYLVTLVLLLAGYLAGEIFAGLRSLRLKREIGRQAKRIASLEAALATSKQQDKQVRSGSALVRLTGTGA
jgi:putative membrane protein